jgi:hypothetical protein
MNKINFISNQKDQNGRFDIVDNSKNAEVSLKFTPGQVVYLIENSKVLKRKIIHVNMQLVIFTDHYDCETLYCLNNGKSYAGNLLFKNLEDIEIIDDTKEQVEKLFDYDDLKDMISEEPKEEDIPF